MLTVSTPDNSVPAPYIITRQKPGYGVALYSHKVILKNHLMGWKYRHLTFDGEIAVYANRKEATETAQYMIGF
jgi:hypothetical protein